MAVQSGRQHEGQPAGGPRAGRRLDSEPAVSGPPPAFVGREAELAAVVDALSDPPALVLVEGEAGIGKTRLLREALAADELGGQSVLVAACPALVEPFPLGPIVDGLRRLRPDVAALGLTALGGALRPLFPEWADDLPPTLEALDDPRETRQRVLAALTELVGRLGVGVLVVEDAHWADTATLEWLLTLITNEPAVGDRAMSLVVTYRPHDVPAGSLLLRLTSRVPPQWNTKRIELDLFDVEQTRHLVGSMLGADEVSEDFAAFLHERTDGLPLAVEEMIRLLRERHDIIRRHGVWSRKVLDELEVPATLRDSVLERMQRLPAAARRVLEAAAVLGAPADDVTLAAVAGLNESSGHRGMAGAFAAALLQETEPGLFVFRHVLDAQAVAEAIPASERRRLHARAAARLRQWEPTPVVRLATHYREAGENEEWCRYAEAAADLALESGGDRATVEALLGVLTGMDHPVERQARLTLKLGQAAFRGAASLGDLAGPVITALRQALAHDTLDPDERGELRLLLGRMLWRTGEQLAALQEFEAAVPDLDHRLDLAIKTMTNLAMPFHPDWPAQRHLYWMERATGLVEQSQQTAPDRMSFAFTRACALLYLGEETGWEAARVTSELPESVSHRRMIAQSALNVVGAMLPWGRYAATRHQLDYTVELVRTADYPRLARDADVTAAWLDWYTGAWAGLRERVEALAEDDEAEPTPQQEARTVLGMLELAAGARVAGEHHLRASAQSFSRSGGMEPWIMLAVAMLARLRLLGDAPDEALAFTGPVLDRIERKGIWVWAADIAPVHLDALVAAGRVDDARELTRRFADGLGGRDAPAAAAALRACEAITAQAERTPVVAAGLFDDAAAAWARLPRPYDELLARERQGECLIEAGVTDQAVSVLSEAQRRLAELGARWDADRIAHRLRGQGVEVARIWHGGRRGYGEQLSPRELEVVELVAQGMTNKQVAEVLFISPRTVTLHLSRAMRKLNVSSRTAVAMAAAEAGLLSTDGGD